MAVVPVVAVVAVVPVVAVVAVVPVVAGLQRQERQTPCHFWHFSYLYHLMDISPNPVGCKVPDAISGGMQYHEAGCQTPELVCNRPNSDFLAPHDRRA